MLSDSSANYLIEPILINYLLADNTILPYTRDVRVEVVDAGTEVVLLP